MVLHLTIVTTWKPIFPGSELVVFSRASNVVTRYRSQINIEDPVAAHDTGRVLKNDMKKDMIGKNWVEIDFEVEVGRKLLRQERWKHRRKRAHSAGKK